MEVAAAVKFSHRRSQRSRRRNRGVTARWQPLPGHANLLIGTPRRARQSPVWHSPPGHANRPIGTPPANFPCTAPTPPTVSSSPSPDAGRQESRPSHPIWSAATRRRFPERDPARDSPRNRARSATRGQPARRHGGCGCGQIFLTEDRKGREGEIGASPPGGNHPPGTPIS